jgi:uncharacterized membrane protein
MWFGPLWMFVWLAVVVAVIVAVIRWLSEKSGSGDKPAWGARDILDERYARGRSIATNT